MAKLAARGGVFGRPSRPRSRSLASRGYGEDMMKVTDFNTLTFDCYGTLIDWERGILAELRPWAGNFEHVLADLGKTFGTTKTDILHTAQSIFHDVVPARAQGLKTMWINRRKSVGGWGATPAPQAPGGAATPDFEVASMADLV